MFQINVTFEQKRQIFIERRLKEALYEFASRQRSTITSFLPIEHLMFSRIIYDRLEQEEERALKEYFLNKGYFVSFIYNDESRTSLVINNCNYNIKYEPYDCICPQEWRKMIEEYCFPWLCTQLNKSAIYAQTSSKLFNFDFDFKSSGIFSSSNNCEQYRNEIFKQPLRWMNTMMVYEIILLQGNKFSVKLKSYEDRIIAMERANVLLFSSIVSVDRIADPNQQDWRRFPRTALKIVRELLLGS